MLGGKVPSFGFAYSHATARRCITGKSVNVTVAAFGAMGIEGGYTGMIENSNT